MYGQKVNLSIGGPITPVVKYLMITNGIIFLLQIIVGWVLESNTIERLFGLSHSGIAHFQFWQLFTYMFLHDRLYWPHIIFNLLGLWMFAGELEQLWGGKRFLNYYLVSGVCAGLFIAVMNYILFLKNGISTVPTIGASGAIYAVLLAYGYFWPNRKALLFFVIPIKMKYLVMLFGIMEFYGTISMATGTGTGVSSIGHLGGLISGFLYIILRLRKPSQQGKSDRQESTNVIGRALKKARINRKKKEIAVRIKAKKIIDQLLEKIARNGMSSLTAKEKKDLEWARKHYYPDNNETLH